MQQVRAILIDADVKTIEDVLIDLEETWNISFKVGDILLHFDPGFRNPIASMPEVMAMFEEGPEAGEHNMAHILPEKQAFQ